MRFITFIVKIIIILTKRIFITVMSYSDADERVNIPANQFVTHSVTINKENAQRKMI